MNKTLTAHVGSKAELSPTPKFRRTSQKRERLEDGSAKLLNCGYIQPGAKTRQLPAARQGCRNLDDVTIRSSGNRACKHHLSHGAETVPDTQDDILRNKIVSSIGVYSGVCEYTANTGTNT